LLSIYVVKHKKALRISSLLSYVVKYKKAI
jgi:hypothetical protein